MQNGDKMRVVEAALLLKRLAKSWPDRAQIRKAHPVFSHAFDPDCEDFLRELLPFKDHPTFQAAPHHVQQKILSCGWLLYNQKTLSIETEIIAPVCLDILTEKLPGLKSLMFKQVISETLADEAYHTLLVTNAISLTQQARRLSFVTSPLDLINNMQKTKAQYSAKWQKQLVHFATAMVSEMFISDYLKLLSVDSTIQPLHRLSVKIHRDDELAHANIFKSIVKCLYAALNKKEKAFFSKIFMQPLTWFGYPDLDAWQLVLQQIQFENASKMIEDCKALTHPQNQYDATHLIQLGEELGIDGSTDLSCEGKTQH